MSYSNFFFLATGGFSLRMDGRYTLEERCCILTRCIRSPLPESRDIGTAVVSICSILFFCSIPTLSDAYPRLSSVALPVLNVFPMPSFSPRTASPSPAPRLFLFSSL
jgi:hypothetical protein